MRLDAPFVRLPFVVDAAALDAEVGALAPELWRAHPEGAPGNTAVPLVAYRGDPDDDRAKGVMAPTPYLAQLPYVRRLLAALDSVIGRTRLMRIEEEGELTSHIDTNYYWRDHLRVHFPVRTTPDVRFECDDEQVHMAAGRPGCSTPGVRTASRTRRAAAHASRRRHRRERWSVAPHRPSRRRAIRRRGRRSGARARHRAREPAVGHDALGARARPRSAPARARRFRSGGRVRARPARRRARAHVAFRVGSLRRRARRARSLRRAA